MTQEDNSYDIEPRRSPILQSAPAPAEPGAAAPAEPATAPGEPVAAPADSVPAVEPIDAAAASAPPGFTPPVCVVEGPDTDDPNSPASQAAAQDAEAHRTVAILGYLIFLLPLLSAPNSRFARYHANQALLVFIAGAALGVFQTFVSLLQQYGPVIDAIAVPLWVLSVLTILLRIIWLILWVVLIGMGMNHAAGYAMLPLPIVGGTTLIHPEPDPPTAQEPVA